MKDALRISTLSMSLAKLPADYIPKTYHCVCTDTLHEGPISSLSIHLGTDDQMSMEATNLIGTESKETTLYAYLTSEHIMMYTC